MKMYLDIFWQFLKLGCISFGGPAAHIGYFQKHFVENLKWVSPSDYAQLVAMGQVLPGPGSSQTGFALGLRRGGLFGGLCAFIGFTLPSFLLMYGLVASQAFASSGNWMYDVINGLKLLAVVVIADAILTMGKQFTTTKATVAIAVLTSILVLLFPSSVMQILCIVIAAAIGMLILPKVSGSNPVSFQIDASEKIANTNKKNILISGYSIGFLLIFIVTLPGAFALFGIESKILEQGGLFYQAGSLVFGGGHVVLPLLQQGLGDSISNDQFLAGYAYAQAVPGPMFTMATYLGGIMNSQSPLTGALVTTLAIFLPGFLLVLALDQVWQNWMSHPKVKLAVSGINASVVGLLLAAFYQPVFISSIKDEVSFSAAVLGFFLLRFVKLPVVTLVFGFALLGIYI
ncbi:MAG: chromate efflux transporter [Gammaproteobacteria bacterium]|nr:chromate efflux transporter [Gammaproteobacteria bacterium]